MGGGVKGPPRAGEAVAEPAPGPALQVIVLGSGGGPLENNVTAFLVRSLARKWTNGSVVAVDAGVHLSAIKSILERTQPANLGQSDGPSLPHTLATGPFAGLEIPNATADANAAHIHKHLIGTYVITHAHLDHIAGFVINTAGLDGPVPKKVIGLPNTITALKTHVFNNVIWPNLSDEDNGVGLLTYMRLVDGGSPAIGANEGGGEGYSKFCYGGLGIEGRSVSHGHWTQRHSDGYHADPRSSMSAPPVEERVYVYNSSAYFLRDQATGREILIFGDVEPDSVSVVPRNRRVWRDAAHRITYGFLAAIFIECSYDDSQAKDCLFGHMTPRYIREEMTALAKEVVAERQKDMAGQRHGSSRGNRKGKRAGDDCDSSLAKRRSTPQLGPTSRELRSKIRVSPRSLSSRRLDPTAGSASGYDNGRAQQEPPPRTAPLSPIRPLCGDIVSPTPAAESQQPGVGQEGQAQELDLEASSAMSSFSGSPAAVPTPLPESPPTDRLRNALKGLKVVVIHVKERMADGREARDVILEELHEHEREAQLGIEYVVSRAGQDFYF